MKKIKYFMSGFVTAILALTLLISAFSFANSNMGTISAVLSSVKIKLNGVELLAKDSKGNILAPIVYNGSTYLPVRAISEAVNVPVTWHAKTNTVYLGKNDLNIPALLLTSIKPFYASSVDPGRSYHEEDNLGNQYVSDNVLRGSGETIYNLNGKYSRLTGTLFQTMTGRDQTSVNKVMVYADDVLIYTGSVTAKVFPQNLDLNIQNCNQLKIVFNSGWSSDNYGLGNLGLYP